MSETMDSLFLVVHVTCGEAYSVSGGQQDVVMIPFTGTADGPYFSGRIIGTGADTQKIPKGGSAFLSARYMLEGEDCGVTDSKALAEFEKMPLTASVVPDGNSVTIKIYKEEK